MNLDAVTAELRPRETWEASDFGARMVRRDAAVIYKVWFALTLPMFLIAVLATIYSPYPTLVFFLWWWLEPLYDGPVLHIISRRLFGEETDARGALRATASIARRNWIYWLTPYRFHFARSLVLPLTQLEGLTGSARRARAKVLNQSTQNHGIGITLAYQHLALSLYMGLILIGFAFVPEAYWDTVGLRWFDQFLESSEITAHILTLLFSYMAQSALHPWFVGSGFGLYINIRTILEAWDIEVSFRRMLQRRAARGVSAAVAIFALALFMVPQPSNATIVELDQHWDTETVSEATDAVFQDDAFNEYQTVTEWVETNPGNEPDVTPTSGNPLAGFFSGIARGISFLIEFGLWILVGAIVLLIFLTRDQWLPYLSFSPERRRKRQRVVLSSGAITAETLPDDIPATVLSLWRSGRQREAAALLYRGTVFGVVTRYGVRLPPSATEGACIRAVDEQASEQADFFKRIVAAWTWCAYASRAPSDAVIERLCGEWPGRYGAVQ